MCHGHDHYSDSIIKLYLSVPTDTLKSWNLIIFHCSLGPIINISIP